MKFEEVLPALREGKKVRRKAYPSDYYIYLKDKELNAFISFFNRTVGEIKLMTRDLLADDWEIVKEKKKVKLRDLTEEQYIKWRKRYCNVGICEKGCQFRFINCACGWLKHKDLYSDKFLDQEIEIE